MKNVMIYNFIFNRINIITKNIKSNYAEIIDLTKRIERNSLNCPLKDEKFNDIHKLSLMKVKWDLLQEQITFNFHKLQAISDICDIALLAIENKDIENLTNEEFINYINSKLEIISLQYNLILKTTLNINNNFELPQANLDIVKLEYIIKKLKVWLEPKFLNTILNTDNLTDNTINKLETFSYRIFDVNLRVPADLNNVPIIKKVMDKYNLEKKDVENQESILNFVSLYNKTENVYKDKNLTQIFIDKIFRFKNLLPKKEFIMESLLSKYLLEDKAFIDKNTRITKFKFFEQNKIEFQSLEIKDGRVSNCDDSNYDESLLSKENLNLLQFFFSKPTVENYFYYIDDCFDKNRYDLIYFFLNLSNSNNILKQYLSYHNLDKPTSDDLIKISIIDYKFKHPLFIEHARQLKLKDIEFLELLQLSILSLESCSNLNKYLIEAKNALERSKELFYQIKRHECDDNVSIVTLLKVESLHKLYVLELQTVQQSCIAIRNIMQIYNSYWFKLDLYICTELPILNELNVEEKTEIYRKEFKNLCLDIDILNLI